MKRILICGADGFIGRNLLEHYCKKKKYKIRATYHHYHSGEYEGVEWLPAELRNSNHVEWALKDVDIVLQFAATTSGANDIVNRPYIHVTDNAVMNSLILRECYEQKVEHLIFPSCTVMYQPSDKALKEEDYNGNDEIYKTYFGVGNTKVYIEKMCEFFSRLGVTKHTVIRHSNIYGQYDKYNLEKSHVFGATITKVMTNTTGELEVWGTGEGGRDLLHVDDLVRFVDLSLEKQESNYELFNVGRGEVVTIIDLIKKIIHYSGKDLKIVHDLSKPSIPTSLYLDCTKAKELLGWSSEIDIDEGIQKVLEWYEREMV
ncbi:MAG: NAD-dependent epimerase/dehydratase family protein [Promethearchaeota archaeon]|jgi:nucleoside-diphosphate-sugar epimerase